MDTNTRKPARAPASNTGKKTNTDKYTPLLVNAETAAHLLCMGARPLWSWSRCGAIPSYKVGRSIRYRPDELQAWIDAGCPTTPGAAKQIRASMRKAVRR